MRVYVNGLSVWGPGLDGWCHAAPILAGNEPYLAKALALPIIELLPPAERRRAGLAIKLALTSGSEAIRAAGEDASQTATVFASSGGDGETVHQILETLTTEQREVSPTRFHNSVHNAPSGYWALAVQCHAPSAMVSSHDASFAVGFLEATSYAIAEQRPVMLIAYDVPYPEPLNSCRRIIAGFAVAMVLGVRPDAGSAVLDLTLETAGVAHETVMGCPQLEALRLGNPAARALPLLVALAMRKPAQVVVPGIGAAHLVINASPSSC